METNRAVFLDKDGTLIRDIPYNVNPELITLSDAMIQGLRKLMRYGYRLIVISNQSGVAMGFFEYDLLYVAERRIREMLEAEDIVIDEFYYCPHHPQGFIREYSKRCSCRKPAAGLLKTAAAAHHIDLSQSWMIGDILNDVEAGNTAGCRTILINNGNETEWHIKPSRIPDGIFADINAAADYIIEMVSLSRWRHSAP